MTLAKETRPDHCYDWLRPEDLTTIAIKALTRIRLECKPPAGQRFVDDEGRSWTTRREFAEELCIALEHHLKAFAWRQGVCDEWERTAMYESQNDAWVAREVRL